MIDYAIGTAQADVEEFMEAMGQTVREFPSIPTPEELDLRITLITEEFDETIDALLQCRMNGGPATQRIAEVADGIADSIYVLLGAAASFGIDMEPIWEEVQRSNMAKTDGHVRPDGKRMKPEGWEPPRIAEAIIQQYEEYHNYD